MSYLDLNVKLEDKLSIIKLEDKRSFVQLFRRLSEIAPLFIVKLFISLFICVLYPPSNLLPRLKSRIYTAHWPPGRLCSIHRILDNNFFHFNFLICLIP